MQVWKGLAPLGEYSSPKGHSINIYIKKKKKKNLLITTLLQNFYTKTMQFMREVLNKMNDVVKRNK